MNALAASMNTIASGGLAIPYTFSTTTTDADPGAHFLRLSSATQDASTAIRLSVTDAQDSDRTNQIALFDDSTSTVKGHLLLMDATDATKFIFFSVSALSALGSPPLAYHNITVTKVASSEASPFANNASLLLSFTLTGDKGDTGSTGSSLTLGTSVVASGTAVDFTGIPSGVRMIVVSCANGGFSTNGTSNILIRLGDSGGIETSEYAGAGVLASGGGNSITASTAGFILNFEPNAENYGGAITFTLENAATNLWVGCGLFTNHSTKLIMTSGEKALSGVLDRVRITTVNGTNAFNGGHINIAYL